MRNLIMMGALLSILLAGCFGSGEPPLSQADQVGTVVAQTQLAQTAVALTGEAALADEATDVPPVTIGAGDALPPEQAATGDAATEGAPGESSTRVSFAPGATGAAFDSTVEAGQVDEYVVLAMAGQIMQVTLSPPTGPVYLDIRGADGANLIPDGSQWTSFWSSLPDTQDYMIRVISAGEAQSYSINIVIPAMITFGTGETYATITGQVGQSARVDYLIFAQAGQEMHVTVTTAGVQVALSITGMIDGQPYLRYVAEETDWTFTLPTTQYYKISVVTISPATDFTLVVEVN